MITKILILLGIFLTIPITSVNAGIVKKAVTAAVVVKTVKVVKKTKDIIVSKKSIQRLHSILKMRKGQALQKL